MLCPPSPQKKISQEELHPIHKRQRKHKSFKKIIHLLITSDGCRHHLDFRGDTMGNKMAGISMMLYLLSKETLQLPVEAINKYMNFLLSTLLMFLLCLNILQVIIFTE